MGNNFNIELSEEQYNEILKQAEENVRSKILDYEVRAFFGNCDHIPSALLRNYLNIDKRYESIEEVKVRDLTREGRLIIALHTLLYDKFI